MGDATIQRVRVGEGDLRLLVDAHVADDMSGLRLMDADYDWLTAFCLDVAGRHCGGRLVSMLEGGYDLPSLARCAAQHVRDLARL